MPADDVLKPRSTLVGSARGFQRGQANDVEDVYAGGATIAGQPQVVHRYVLAIVVGKKAVHLELLAVNLLGDRGGLPGGCDVRACQGEQAKKDGGVPEGWIDDGAVEEEREEDKRIDLVAMKESERSDCHLQEGQNDAREEDAAPRRVAFVEEAKPEEDPEGEHRPPIPVVQNQVIAVAQEYIRGFQEVSLWGDGACASHQHRGGQHGQAAVAQEQSKRGQGQDADGEQERGSHLVLRGGQDQGNCEGERKV